MIWLIPIQNRPFCNIWTCGLTCQAHVCPQNRHSCALCAVFLAYIQWLDLEYVWVVSSCLVFAFSSTDFTTISKPYILRKLTPRRTRVRNVCYPGYKKTCKLITNKSVMFSRCFFFSFPWCTKLELKVLNLCLGKKKDFWNIWQCWPFPKLIVETWFPFGETTEFDCSTTFFLSSRDASQRNTKHREGLCKRLQAT